MGAAHSPAAVSAPRAAHWTQQAGLQEATPAGTSRMDQPSMAQRPLTVSRQLQAALHGGGPGLVGGEG